MVEEPAGVGCEEDGGDLILEGVEDVTPVYVLVGCQYQGRKRKLGGEERWGNDLPHLLRYECHIGGIGEIVRK